MDFLNTISNNRFWNKHGVQVVWAIAVICLTVAVSNIVWTVYSQTKIKQSNYQPQKVARNAKAPRQSYRVSDIVSANLFGDPRPKIAVKKAPKTTLDLTLQGILWATDQNLARAIIMSGKKRSELYSVGESIKGAGASIKEIRTDEVLLNRNGATESLPLARKKQSDKGPLISYADTGQSSPRRAKVRNSSLSQSIQRSSPLPKAANGAPRKIRKPNFSGLDRALRKRGEI